MQIISYLTFNGNCYEAMTYYQECLGGELTFQTLGDSPLSEKMSKKMKSCIVHASLFNEGLTLLASDMVGENGLLKGNSVSLSLSCNSEEEIKMCYAKLAAGGTANKTLSSNFTGVLIGNLTDKFGIHWILTYINKQQ